MPVDSRTQAEFNLSLIVKITGEHRMNELSFVLLGFEFSNQTIMLDRNRFIRTEALGWTLIGPNLEN